MKTKNSICQYAPEELLGSWIKCTNDEAEKLLKYFKMPVISTADGVAYYNICQDRQSYVVSPLCDNRIRCWFAFYCINFPETETMKKINIHDCIGKWIKCTALEFMYFARFLKIKIIVSYDGYYRLHYPCDVDFKVNYGGDYIDFKNIEFINNTRNKTIIGYKCPVDLFSGRVKAGKLYTRYNDIDLYSTTGSDFPKGYFTLPKEIVETWEPMYKYAKNTTLLTKDGRVCGNAIITDYAADDSYVITTDDGNKITFSEQEVENQWYIGSVKDL